MLLLDEELPRELVWSDDQTAGITRRRAGSGFSYIGPNGRAIRGAELDRVRALAVPPAWTDVWICPHDRGHIQATGRDARGRKQYRYHARYRAHREQAKFDQLADFGAVLPSLRSRVAQDLGLRGVPRDKVVATVVRLLETTLVRVGNEEYARTNNSYGLTTLRDRHAQFSSDGLSLVFKGKHGIAANVKIQDARLRRVVKQCQDLPGQTLFQYIDDGEQYPVTSTDVNTYLRDATGADVTAKDFRTWMGTLLAASTLAEEDAPESERDAKRTITQMLEGVSNALGNTPAVCRGSYVHPAIIDWFADGSLGRRWDRASARGSRLLIPDERKLLVLLRAARRVRSASAKAA